MEVDSIDPSVDLRIAAVLLGGFRIFLSGRLNSNDGRVYGLYCSEYVSRWLGTPELRCICDD